MKLPSLFTTTAIRLVFRYIAVYMVVLGIVLGALLLTTNYYVDSSIKADLKGHLQTIRNSYNAGGMEHAIEQAELLTKYQDKDNLYYLFSSPEGVKLSGNLTGWSKEASIALDGTIQNVWLEDNIIPFELEEDEVYWPVIATEFNDGSRLLLTHGVEQFKELHELTEFLLEALGVALVLAFLMGISLSRAILSRLENISSTAEEIMAGDFSQRIPVSDKNDEFDALAGQLNMMLDRIQQLIAGIRNVTDNVAHDLRSPLTRLHNRLEITLLEKRSEEEYRRVINHAVEDTDSIINTFNALLRIAQAESGNHREQWTRFDADKLAVDLVEIYRPLAEDKKQSLEITCDMQAEVTGNSDLIAQALSNLLDNAIKYTPADGKIRLEVIVKSTAIEIITTDTGPGIPQAEKEHVLERFVRLETSRNMPGNGLGLSLVQAICKLHKADLILDDANPGLLVKIRFPRTGYA